QTPPSDGETSHRKKHIRHAGTVERMSLSSATICFSGVIHTQSPSPQGLSLYAPRQPTPHVAERVETPHVTAAPAQRQGSSEQPPTSVWRANNGHPQLNRAQAA